MTDLIVFGLVFLPVLLALLFLFVKFDQYSRSVMAVGAAGGQLLLSLVALAQISWNQPEKTQVGEAFRFSWSSLWSIEFSLALSTVGGPLLFLFCILFLVSFLCSAKILQGRERMASLLFLQGAINGVVLSNTLFAASFFSAAAALPIACLLALDQNMRSGWSLHKFLSIEVAATIFGSIALVGVVLHGATNVEEWFVLSSGNYQSDGRSLMFFSLCLSFLFRSFCYPFHFSKSEWTKARPLSLMMPALGAGTIGLFGFFQFIPKMFPAEWARFHLVFAIIGLGSILWSSLHLVVGRSHRKNLHFILSLFQGFALLGFSTSHQFGVLGAWLIYLFTFLAIVVYCTLLIFSEERSADIAPIYTAENPQAGFSFALSQLAIYCFPVSLGFYSVAFVLWGLATENFLLFAAASLSVPLVLYSAVKNLFPLANISAAANWTREPWTRFELGLFFPLGALLLLSGIFPNWIVNMVLPTVEMFLKLLGGK